MVALCKASAGTRFARYLHGASGSVGGAQEAFPTEARLWSSTSSGRRQGSRQGSARASALTKALTLRKTSIEDEKGPLIHIINYCPLERASLVILLGRPPCNMPESPLKGEAARTHDQFKVSRDWGHG